MKIYVNCNQPFPGMGTKACPFSTIQQAADAAMPGDEVLVAPGIYREDVHPLRGGSEENRIIYRAEVPGQSVITGAEVLSQWEECGCGIWKTVIPNDVLGEDNPFADLISGDWYYDDAAEPVHRADIYLDNRSLREVFTREALLAAEPSPYAWDTEFSRNVWMSERTETETTLYLHLLCGSPDFGVQRAPPLLLPHENGYPFHHALRLCLLQGSAAMGAADSVSRGHGWPALGKGMGH